MELSISNIAWNSKYDLNVYKLMKKLGFTGLEIAPTRIFSESPYEKLTDAAIWKQNLTTQYGFVVPSMQSIWFGRQENLFGTSAERQILMEYSKKAIDFAAAIGCKNLVFGCPRNRTVPDRADSKLAITFFKELGDYAAEHGAVIGMEANPPIYNTNFINTTKSALDLIREVDSKGFLLNLDIGTMIYNGEDISELIGHVKYINHIHVSEPKLKVIEKRELHQDLKVLLEEENYTKYVSIEMCKQDTLYYVEEVMQYIRGIYGDK